MRKARSLVALLLTLSLSLGLLVGCNREKKPEEVFAIKVGDHLISEAEYARTARIMRQNYLTDLGQEETAALWEEKINENMTLSAATQEATRNQLVWLYLYQYEFERLGLALTEEEKKAIDEDLQATITSVGSLSELHKILEQQGYTYEEYQQELLAHAKKAKVLDYYFGAQGVQKKTSDQDIKDWYNVNYAYLKAIYFWRENTQGEALPESEQLLMKQKAEDAYTSASRESATDLFPEIMSIYHDSLNGTISAGEFLLHKEADENEKLLSTAMGLAQGGVALVEMGEAYAVIKRYDGCAGDRFTKDLRIKTLEDIRKNPIEELLADWEKALTVEINPKITQKYAPEKLMKEQA